MRGILFEKSPKLIAGEWKLRDDGVVRPIFSPCAKQRKIDLFT
jgi:hypothetical protein